MPATDCPHGYTSALSCIDCMEDGNLPPRPRPEVEVEYPFVAQYTSPCGSDRCPHGLIEPGQHAVKMTDGTYRHLDCTDAT